MEDADCAEHNMPEDILIDFFLINNALTKTNLDLPLNNAKTFLLPEALKKKTYIHTTRYKIFRSLWRCATARLSDQCLRPVHFWNRLREAKRKTTNKKKKRALDCEWEENKQIDSINSYTVNKSTFED